MVEVHIPSKGVYGRLEPTESKGFDSLPDDLGLLRDIEAHEVTQIARLEKSNRLLADALQDNEDEEFRLAIKENKLILPYKKERLQQVRNKILQLDPMSKPFEYQEKDGAVVERPQNQNLINQQTSLPDNGLQL